MQDRQRLTQDQIMPMIPLSPNDAVMRPAFRWLAAALCLCMTAVFVYEGMRLVLSDHRVVVLCRSDKAFCELGGHMLRMFPAHLQGFVLGTATLAAAGFMGWIAWMFLRGRSR